MNNASFRLLPSLQFTPHISGQRRWYAVEDPQSGRFLKLGTPEYLVASGLQNGVSPTQIVDVLEQHGFDQPKERVTSTISWLAKQGLLLTESNSRTASPESVDPDAPKVPRPTKPLAAPSLSIDPFFIRLPLLSGPLAERLAKPFAWLISWPCGLAWIGLLAAALLAVVNGSERLWSLNEKLFVEDGRLWWLAAWFVLKCIHEMGHAVAGVSTGSRIRSAGLHFIFLAPVPYVDVTDLWRVTNGRQRMLVSAAGMLAEIAAASIAVLVAFQTTNLQLQYFCAAVATLGTITTIAFNGNPLMKFDGYYILSDYFSRPNLWTEAQTAAGNLIKRILNPFTGRLGLGSGGWSSHGLHAGLTAFGLTTMFYRFVMLGTMAWWLLTVWHGIGALVIAWAVWGWFVRPVWQKRSNLKAAIAAGLVPPSAGEASAGQQRIRWVYTLGLIAICVAIGFLPCPGGITAPGIVGFGEPTTVRTAAEGVLLEVLVADRQQVQAGDLIARLENPQLSVELTDARLKHQASQEQANALRARGELAMLQAEQAKMESLASHILQLEDRTAQLDVRAPCAGMLLMSLAEKIEGRFVKPGTPLCMIVHPESLEVVASASQRDASLFVQQVNKYVWVAATGSSGKPGKLLSVDSRGSEHCDQSALAARYGGPLPVEFSTNEAGEQVLKYSAPRFPIKAALDIDSQHSWYPGQLVWLSLTDRHERIWQWIVNSFNP